MRVDWGVEGPLVSELLKGFKPYFGAWYSGPETRKFCCDRNVYHFEDEMERMLKTRYKGPEYIVNRK